MNGLCQHVLDERELGFVTDTGEHVLGDGVTVNACIEHGATARPTTWAPDRSVQMQSLHAWTPACAARAATWGAATCRIPGLVTPRTQKPLVRRRSLSRGGRHHIHA